MAIYTPRGLKIRLPLPYVFGLLSRLSPKVSAFRVLKTTEGIESLPGMLAFVGGIISFLAHLAPLHIGLIVAIAQFAGSLGNRFGFYRIPGLVPLGTSFSYIEGYGPFFVIILVIGISTSNWVGVAAFLAGKIVGGVISFSVELWLMSRLRRPGCKGLTPSDLNFFAAYRLHASRIGVTTSVGLKDEEIEETHWMPTFVDLAMNWPKVVARFTQD